MPLVLAIVLVELRRELVVVCCLVPVVPVGWRRWLAVVCCLVLVCVVLPFVQLLFARVVVPHRFLELPVLDGRSAVVGIDCECTGRSIAFGLSRRRHSLRMGLAVVFGKWSLVV